MQDYTVVQVSRALTCQLSSEVGHTNKVDNRLGYVQGLDSLKLAAGSYQVAACRSWLGDLVPVRSC